ncbi:MAG: molybdopterin cofactor-binding domain-containing protein [Chloroflexota bacterium]|nr:molybdopterin cofactor-binding domain-containing protein [Chloroflexota bacterium]
MNIILNINQQEYPLIVPANETLLRTLRKLGFFSIKKGRCEKGECGACTVLIDGQPVNSCSILSVQAEGHLIETVEALGEHPKQGWKETQGLHVIQQAFVETGAIQCGYCTPAMVLTAKALLGKEPSPTETQVRKALSGVLCRCTGYQKPVQAVLRAAAILRGEEVPMIDEAAAAKSPSDGHSVFPKMKHVEDHIPFDTVGHAEPKVDAVKLVQGKPAFTADFAKRDMLFAKVLRSPHAHAEIKHIDTSKAKTLPGVAAVLTWEDIPRVVYSTAGQSHPIPGPLDTFSLDHKVRFVGDRVALVAAKTPEIAQAALNMIDVEYEVLLPVIDSTKAMEAGAPIIHDEEEYVNFDKSDASKNLAAKIRIDIGDVEKGFTEADHIFEEEFEVPKQHQAYIEPHIAMTYWDENDRLVITTSTQVPFHVRRQLAPVLGLPIKRIRVIKPRVGGAFGGKQEVLIEDVAAHLTIATGRPVIYEMSLEEEFLAARPRHPMRIRLKTGVKDDGTITANEMYCLSDTGAYGCHALTVAGNTGHKAMALYVGDGPYREHPNIRFYADAVYTNTVPSGAFRGYGVPQGFWAIERQLEKIARTLNLDPLEFRLKNTLRPNELHPFSTAWSEGREPQPETIHTVGLEECVRQGRQAIGWDEKYGNKDWHNVPGSTHLKRGVGVALLMQGTAIPHLDMGGASIKMNDDASFNLLVGATDLGTGSDTVLGQMAAETLGVPLEDIIVYSSDTDMTPFDKGAYASSTTYISGAATTKAAQIVAYRIRRRAARLFAQKGIEVKAAEILLKDRNALTPSGESISLKEIALDALHMSDQEQIMGVASHVSPVSPPPFAAQFAEVTVDIDSGMVTVDKLVMAVDSGIIINPLTASGQVEGGMAQALGYAVCEEMVVDEEGQPREKDFVDYHIFRANEMPEMQTIFVETQEPSHPFGVKSVAEIPMDGVAPAVGNAVLDACGASLTKIPILPEDVWRALNHLPKQNEVRS